MTIEYLFGVPAQFKYFKEILPGSQFGNSVITDFFTLYEYRKSYYLQNSRTKKFFKIADLSVLDKSICTIRGKKTINAAMLFHEIGDRFFDLR